MAENYCCHTIMSNPVGWGSWHEATYTHNIFVACENMEENL
jgi:hypothetical protein